MPKNQNMASKGMNSLAWRLVLPLVVVIFLFPDASFAAPKETQAMKMNVIDRCWRQDPLWRKNKQKLARCSIGFAGKMLNNVGKGLVKYTVTDPSDNPTNPKPGTLRYGATMIKGKVWITFKRNMKIKLERPLLISSFTAIDGRGANVHIANGGCLFLYEATDVIIHGLHIHHCKPQAPGMVMSPTGLFIMGRVDGDAIRMVSSKRIWIDHNTLSECSDGLVDVTRGSTNITISNNLFRDHNKVMLLGHNDGFILDKKMQVTIVYNHFGPNCQQRMPRVRRGYAHIANNLYDRWIKYAIGGSMKPSIRSQGNLFIAREHGNKEVTWKEGIRESRWTFISDMDKFENGASFKGTGLHGFLPKYSKEQEFPIAKADSVRELTKSAGALLCPRGSVHARC